MEDSRKATVADPDLGPGAFLTHGMGKNQNPDHISESLESIFWDPESFLPWNRDGKIRIRDKHPWLAGGVCTIFRLSQETEVLDRKLLCSAIEKIRFTFHRFES
jgi:hypothetical protein